MAGNHKLGRAANASRKFPYSRALADDILEAFAAQDLSLARFCDSTPGIPGSKTVWRWMHDEEGFKALVDTARERQLERMMYGSIDTLVACDPVSESVRPGDGAAIVAKHKAVAELTQKLASKMVPRKFCERVAVDFDGKMEGRVQVVIDNDDVEVLDEKALGA